MEGSTSWDHPRLTAGIRAHLAVAAARSVAADTVLAGTGLHETDLHTPHLEVRATQELTTVRNLLEVLDDDPASLGIEASRHWTVGGNNVLGPAMLTCATLGHAIELLVRFPALSPTFARFALADERRHVAVVVQEPQILEGAREFLVARDLYSAERLLPALLGRPIGVRYEIRVGSAIGPAFVDVAGPDRVRIGSPRTACLVPLSLLDEPLQMADQQANGGYVRECEVLLERHRRGASDGVAERVRVRLLASPETRTPMTAIARDLGVDVRTLRRRLTDEGTSYRELERETRQGLAAQLLSRGLSVGEVAARTGYVGASSFSFAFKRWHGVSPGHYQRSTSRHRAA